MPTQSLPRPARTIVSFVRRGSRMNASQQRGWDTWHDQYVVDVPRGERRTSVAPEARVDWSERFGRTAPLVVEIGSGNGESLVEMARVHPERDVVAFEVFEPAVASTISHLGREGVGNVRLVMGDAVEGLEWLFAPASLSEVWVFFPDPWPKPRHHKRRLVSPAFAALVASRLAPGGVLRLATDWEEYAWWMRDVLDSSPLLRNDHPETGWAPRLAERPVTRFEQRGLDAGRTVHDLTYRRV